MFQILQNNIRASAAKIGTPDLNQLADKFNISHPGQKFQAFCPGIMNPLDETQDIESFWLTSFKNNPNKFDKFDRAQKLLDVLTKIDNLSNTFNKDDLISFVLNSPANARVMLVKIAQHNIKLKEASHKDLGYKILKAVEEYIFVETDHCDSNQAQYPDKSSITNEKVLHHYLDPVFNDSEYLNYQLSSEPSHIIQIAGNGNIDTVN